MKIEEIKKAIDAIQAKLDKAKEDYTDAARRCQQGIGFYPLLEGK